MERVRTWVGPGADLQWKRQGAEVGQRDSVSHVCVTWEDFTKLQMRMRKRKCFEMASSIFHSPGFYTSAQELLNGAADLTVSLMKSHVESLTSG